MKVNLERQPVGMFAVMRHSKGGKRMHFSMLHKTYDAAQHEAQRLAAEMIETHGPENTGLYIMEIQGRVGIFDGKLEYGDRMV